ncbi:alpha/beta hydrolase fold domain-containing protein [Chryseosolibacter indicus]|uniref:Alpha/beta hydrolase n=1 Tax=Chryseosolibacter indicus TaxID=2782351 RepID=A0ABS5VZS0_9BACT|nr:alpha/beta hydrolase [Chryseosolibacter indicus]MBT1706357.1 alpha/beta hydrolase [Chryseosolibacter indicus]
MASVESKLFNILLRLINKKKFLEMQFAFGKFDFYNSREPSREARRACHIERHFLNGRNVFTMSPKHGRSNKHILYLHGGAYVQNFVRQHWNFLSMLVRHTHCTITAPDYPLAPKYTYRDAFDMVSPLYTQLIQKAGSVNTILMGDSAGGGFALALAQKKKNDNEIQSGKIILLSPWLDLTLKNPEIEALDPLDPFLSIQGLRKAGRAYAGNSDLDNYMLSPINGPLEGLGEITIFSGSRDILCADARRLNLLGKAKGINIKYHEYKDMVHVWMLLNFTESKKAQKEIIALING